LNLNYKYYIKIEKIIDTGIVMQPIYESLEKNNSPSSDRQLVAMDMGYEEGFPDLIGLPTILLGIVVAGFNSAHWIIDNRSDIINDIWTFPEKSFLETDSFDAEPIQENDHVYTFPEANKGKAKPNTGKNEENLSVPYLTSSDTDVGENYKKVLEGQFSNKTPDEKLRQDVIDEAVEQVIAQMENATMPGYEIIQIETADEIVTGAIKYLLEREMDASGLMELKDKINTRKKEHGFRL
jgi:hypothetical protein